MFKKINKKSRDLTVIAGCGRLGASFANVLSDEDNSVLIIDQNKDSFRKLSSSFGGLTLAGDATDIDILNKGQIDKATMIIAVTDNDNTNIMISQMAKELFEIDCVIVRLNNPDKEYILQESGIDTINPASLSMKAIREIICSKNKGKEQ